MKESVFSQNEIDKLIKQSQDRLHEAFINRSMNAAKKNQLPKAYKIQRIIDVDTSISTDKLMLVGEKTTSYPADIKANPKLKQLFDRRRKMLSSNQPEIDWAMAESLAFGTLLIDGYEIRFSGQDSRRGTFSQRHSVVTDIETEEQFIPLNHIQEGQTYIRIYDSPLSELSVLGFEYGYSVIAKRSLVLWEAQFGDFANMAQAMIDQIIVCAEVKWQQTSNLTILLPHSYDGQGPEHSSARLERYLQLAAEDNIIVCNLTTPSNYYHALRRQALNPNRKPMIIMTPKSMLRHPKAVSSFEDLASGRLMKVIPSNNLSPDKVKTITFTSGKVYYDVLAAIEENSREDISLNRIEQLYPFDSETITSIIQTYPNAKNIVWLQEEPKNMGAWNYISPQIAELINSNHKLSYIGRRESASTATGSATIHNIEQKQILQDLLSL
jgi:2-oxoglutarate dehydrogenase E1 component